MYAIQNLISYFNGCKKDDLYRNVIEKILGNLDKLGDATIYEWANICFASPTTISRLSRKLGYTNFASFKLDLINAYESYKMGVRQNADGGAEALEAKVSDYFARCKAAAEEFAANFDMTRAEEVAEIIHSCDQIRLYSTVLDTPMMILQEDLLMSGKEAVMLSIISDQLQDAQALTKNTLVVLHASAFNDGVLMSSVQQVILEIKKRGAKLVVISDSPQPRYLNYADYCYTVNGGTHGMFQQQYDMFIHVVSMIYRTKYVEERAPGSNPFLPG